MIKFLDILGRYEAAEVGQLEAAELLGVGERTFRRWRQRHEHLVADHGFRWGYTWTKTFLHTKGLLEKAARRGAGASDRGARQCGRHQHCQQEHRC